MKIENGREYYKLKYFFARKYKEEDYEQRDADRVMFRELRNKAEDGLLGIKL